MKVTINERKYELKELTKEEAKAYIGKEVYVWDYYKSDPVKTKLLEVFDLISGFPFCVLSTDKVSANYYIHCAPVPEEWYVNYYEPEGIFKVEKEYSSGTIVDHGSHDYCVQKAKELYEHEETAEHPLTNYELSHLLKCIGVDICYNKEAIFNVWQYVSEAEGKQVSDEYKIRYKRGEWMPATRETVMKWVEERVKQSELADIERFVSFMGWDVNKE